MDTVSHKPTLHLIDIPRIVANAKAHPSHQVVLVDNTFMSPFYSSPLLQGADIVLQVSRNTSMVILMSLWVLSFSPYVTPLSANA